MNREEFVSKSSEEQKSIIDKMITEYVKDNQMRIWISQATPLKQAWNSFLKNHEKKVESEITFTNGNKGIDIHFCFNDRTATITKIRFWKDGKNYKSVDLDMWDELEVDATEIYYYISDLVDGEECENEVKPLFGTLDDRIFYFFLFAGYKYRSMFDNYIEHRESEVIEDFIYCGEKAWESVFDDYLKENLYQDYEENPYDYEEPSKIFVSWSSDRILFTSRTEEYGDIRTNRIVFYYRDLKKLEEHSAKVIYSIYLGKIFDSYVFPKLALSSNDLSMFSQYKDLLEKIKDDYSYLDETIDTIREIGTFSFEYASCLLSELIIFTENKLLTNHFDEIIKIFFRDIDKNFVSMGEFITVLDFIFRNANPDYYFDIFQKFITKRIKKMISLKTDIFTNVFLNWLKWREKDYRNLAAEVCCALEPNEQKVFLERIDSKELVAFLQLRIIKNERNRAAQQVCIDSILDDEEELPFN